VSSDGTIAALIVGGKTYELEDTLRISAEPRRVSAA
jgi:hypothetical protein